MVLYAEMRADMIIPEFFCKIYTRPVACRGYYAGECIGCAKADTIMIMICDNCRREIPEGDEYEETDRKHICKKCKAEMNGGKE